MNKQEQIDEIYECIKYNTGSYDDDARGCAEILYNYLGYRKSEWISVEDRLPEDKGFYIVNTTDNKVHVTLVHPANLESWVIQFKKHYTHWIPLPTPPTEKEN